MSRVLFCHDQKCSQYRAGSITFGMLAKYHFQRPFTEIFCIEYYSHQIRAFLRKKFQLSELLMKLYRVTLKYSQLLLERIL